jgi:hypothetical protein
MWTIFSILSSLREITITSAPCSCYNGFIADAILLYCCHFLQSSGHHPLSYTVILQAMVIIPCCTLPSSELRALSFPASSFPPTHSCLFFLTYHFLPYFFSQTPSFPACPFPPTYYNCCLNNSFSFRFATALTWRGANRWGDPDPS